MLAGRLQLLWFHLVARGPCRCIGGVWGRRLGEF